MAPPWAAPRPPPSGSQPGPGQRPTGTGTGSEQAPPDRTAPAAGGVHLNLGALPAAGRLVEQCFELAALASDVEDELVAQTLSGALAPPSSPHCASGGAGVRATGR